MAALPPVQDATDHQESEVQLRYRVAKPKRITAEHVLAIFKSFVEDPQVNRVLFAYWAQVSRIEAERTWIRLRTRYGLVAGDHTPPVLPNDYMEDFQTIIKATWSCNRVPRVDLDHFMTLTGLSHKKANNRVKYITLTYFKSPY